ncbi:unnamed protein product [Owenia fusiformis]|uniref:Uncharacterized protein n=1 Tax=Owenia fusiformis TaxID=6347 RepID=A0A8J1U7F0_OWEFU|nr:unnamed protein product [Owenia fusiformis]
MSQVGIQSRPGTQMSLKRVGIEIQHPLSRLGNPERLDIQAMAITTPRPGSEMGLVSQNRGVSASGRSMANEVEYPKSLQSPRKSHSSTGRMSSQNRIPHFSTTGYADAIPEGVEVTQGDPSKTRLPVFGVPATSRSDVASRAASRMSTASAQARLEIDELESVLKDKANHHYFELRKRFKDNDPEGKGNCSREALSRIVVTLIGRPLNQVVFGRLMNRLGLGQRAVISFADFFKVFRERHDSEYPNWMDPIQRTFSDKANTTADEVHIQLKEKAKQRILDAADMFPQSNPDGATHILKPEFRIMLNKNNYFLDDDEFDRLWKRYDPTNSGTINGANLMRKLGVSVQHRGSTAGDRLSPIDDDKLSPRSPTQRKIPRKVQERQRSLHVESWLKTKFREGFKSMKGAFAEHDKDHKGIVSFDVFLNVLNKYGLKLDRPHLSEFCSRCNIVPKKDGVPYKDFLSRFQDRSEAGMTHNILSNSNHKYNRSQTPGARSSLSAIESNLMNLFQREFLQLLGTFHKVDQQNTDLLSQEAFRAAIESRFNLGMTDEQFQTFIEHVPLNHEGMVKYADFMAQFDTRGQAPSLFDSKSVIIQPEVMSPEPFGDHEVDRLVMESPPLEADAAPRRPTHELFKIIKQLLTTKYEQVEREFQDIDEWNSKRLNQETAYKLLQRFNLDPEISRGEVRSLWKTLITNKDKSLNFQEFTRHFGFSLKSAAYPNAKLSPPKKGDVDFQIRSRKLNCAADMLHDNLKSKIDYMWEDLHKEFTEMDPYKTCYISKDEFTDVLQELCVYLGDHELKLLTEKFDVKKDGRVNYVEFLKPFAAKRQTWRHGNNLLSMLQHPVSEMPMSDIPEPPQNGLTGLTSKLRQKLSGDWKNLRRAFKKLDKINSGYLSVPEFRSVLKLCNIILDEDDVYQVMQSFDEEMTGKVSYHKFLNETFQAAIPPKRRLDQSIAEK